MQAQVVTFGEIMLRLSPPGHSRLGQTKSFDATFGGDAANVAVSLSNLGIPVDFVTRLPDNELGRVCEGELRRHSVGVKRILWGGDRLGIYFLEVGAVSRPSKVVYDRTGSAFAAIEPGMLDWQAILTGAEWFHWSGISPAVSRTAAATCLEAVRAAKDLGLIISCDLNYRKKLWKWASSASEVMSELVPLCDVVLANEEDTAEYFGIVAPNSDTASGTVDPEDYFAVCAGLHGRFPNLRTIAITLRGSISASSNTWSGLLWSEGEIHVAPKYEITPIVDRVGAGDSFMAGLIYGILTYGQDSDKIVRFAAAASCLKHTIQGDFNLAAVEEVERLVGGEMSGRVSR